MTMIPTIIRLHLSDPMSSFRRATRSKSSNKPKLIENGEKEIEILILAVRRLWGRSKLVLGSNFRDFDICDKKY